MHAPVLIATLTDPHGRQTSLWEPGPPAPARCLTVGGGLGHDLPVPGLPVAAAPAALLTWERCGRTALAALDPTVRITLDGRPIGPEETELPSAACLSFDRQPVWFERPAADTRDLPMAIEAQAVTHAGFVREINEDAHLIAAPQGTAGGTLLAVLDGCGGHAAGEVASTTARDALAGWLDEGARERLSQSIMTDRHGGLWEAAASLRLAVAAVNAALRARAREERAGCDMATTLTAALVIADWLVAAHLGDSRLYLFRSGALRRLTCDHNRPSRLAEEGLLPWEETDLHPQAHILTRVVGGQPTHALLHEVEIAFHRLEPGDRLLLCTDGLTRMLPEAQLRGVLQSGVPAPEAGGLLLNLALAAGAEDNVTLIAADLTAAAAGSDSEPPIGVDPDVKEIPNNEVDGPSVRRDL